jgi:hypothetical protein
MTAMKFQIKNKGRIVELILLILMCMFIVFVLWSIVSNNINNNNSTKEKFGRRRRRGGVGSALRSARRGATRTTDVIRRSDAGRQADSDLDVGKQSDNLRRSDAGRQADSDLDAGKQSDNLRRSDLGRGTDDTFREGGYIEQGANATANQIEQTANQFASAVSGVFDKDKCEGKDAKLNDYKNPEIEKPEANPPNELNLTLEQETIVDYVGPGYSYAEKIKTPSKLGVKASGDFGTILSNTKAMAKYTGYLVTGPELGNNFFIKSGKCNEESSDECKGQNRWLYVENIPDGSSKCLKDIGIDIPKGSLGGLVPAMMGDVGTIAYAPINIVGSLVSGEPTYSNKCSPMTKKVGPAGKLKKQTRCAPVNMNNYKKCLPSF